MFENTTQPFVYTYERDCRYGSRENEFLIYFPEAFFTNLIIQNILFTLKNQTAISAYRVVTHFSVRIEGAS